MPNRPAFRETHPQRIALKAETRQHAAEFQTTRLELPTFVQLMNVLHNALLVRDGEHLSGRAAVLCGDYL
jgi:hypothetical protein